GGLVEGSLRNGERAVRDGNAGVRTRVQEDLANLLRREAVTNGGDDVHRQLVLVMKRREHRQRDDASLGARQTRPAPDVAPGEAIHEILEWGREVGRLGLRSIDVRVAEHRATNG